MPPEAKGDGGREDVVRAFDVSRETAARLDQFAALLGEWQARTNLVAAGAMAELWPRHIADSLQLAPFAPGARRWVDLGSGGGFPGLILAIARAERPDFHLTLVESNAKKAAFLRAVIRELQLPASVENGRIEAAGAVLGQADAVSARALAALPALLALVADKVRPQVPCYFPKGRTHDEEIVDAERLWRFTLTRHPSRVEAGAAILEVSRIERKLGSEDG